MNLAISHRRWSQAARFDTLLSLPVRPKQHTPWNKTPPASGAKSLDSPKSYETNVPQILSKAIQISRSVVGAVSPESTKSKLYLPNANAARKVNPTAHHASARRNLPPCMVHPIRVVMGATLRLVSGLLEAQGTSQIDKRPRY